MTKFDPEKTYSVGVWGMTFYVYDHETDDFIRHDDGTVIEFHAPNVDYSYMADGIDVDHLQEN